MPMAALITTRIRMTLKKLVGFMSTSSRVYEGDVRESANAASTTASDGLQVCAEGIAGCGITGIEPDAEPLLALLGRTWGPGFGVPLPLGSLLNPIVSHGRCGVECLADLVLSDGLEEAGPHGVVGPNAGVTIGLELGAHRGTLGTRPTSRPG